MFIVRPLPLQNTNPHGGRQYRKMQWSNIGQKDLLNRHQGNWGIFKPGIVAAKPLVTLKARLTKFLPWKVVTLAPKIH